MDELTNKSSNISPEAVKAYQAYVLDDVPDKADYLVGVLTQLQKISLKSGNRLTKDIVVWALHKCKAQKLNPMLDEIYFTWHRGEPMPTAMTSIHAMTKVAHRTGEFCGKDATKFSWRGDKKAKDRQLASATVRIYRYNKNTKVKEAYTATAYFDEFAKKDRNNNITKMWRTMGHRMLEKCAEALAMRVAFPEEFDKVYTSEEMEQARVATDAEIVDVVDPETAKVMESAKANTKARQKTETPKQVTEDGLDISYLSDAERAEILEMEAELNREEEADPKTEEVK